MVVVLTTRKSDPPAAAFGLKKNCIPTMVGLLAIGKSNRTDTTY